MVKTILILQMNKTLRMLLLVCIAGGAGYFSYKAINAAGPEVVAQSYIEAMINGDISTVLSINHRPQKQANLIIRAPKSEQANLLKEMYEGYQRSFEAMLPIDNTTITWAEKFYFVPGIKYQIIREEKKKSPGTPSSDYRFRSVATVVIMVSYPNPDISPEYRGSKIREAILQIDMVQSRDVVKGMQGKPVKEGWLFKWFSIDGGSVVYWDE
jgi:hypothetical protein